VRGNDFKHLLAFSALASGLLWKLAGIGCGEMPSGFSVPLIAVACILTGYYGGRIFGGTCGCAAKAPVEADHFEIRP
jgi:hypothetical protein